ncbi:MAG: DUF4331 family protein [Bacteroidota bacterium]
MKNLRILTLMACIATITTLMSCGDDEGDMDPMVDEPVANAGIAQSADLEKTVTLDGSASMGENITYAWTVTGPTGNNITLANPTGAMPSFVVGAAGQYDVSLTVTNDGGSNTATTTVTGINPTFTVVDQMGKPGINTLFNYFADGPTKNAFNSTTPDGGNEEVAFFESTLDFLQEYIGLNSDTYTNVLGLDNTTTATVLSTDALTSNLDFPSTYGPSDLGNIVAFQNVLNGRNLADDPIDVTLILIFGEDLQNLSDLQTGLISDNVQTNDVDFSSSFPYLAAPF